MSDEFFKSKFKFSVSNYVLANIKLLLQLRNSLICELFKKIYVKSSAIKLSYPQKILKSY